jgi:hypothetical protein
MDKAMVERLAALIEGGLKAREEPQAKPRLRLVGKAELQGDSGGLDSVSRDVMVSRIRDLARMYWLAWLVRQETAHVGHVVECLNDDDLTALLRKMEHGRECRVEGIGFDEAGLVREQGGDYEVA